MDENNNELELELEPDTVTSIDQEETPQIIKIVGVGGAGCNAVRNMYEMGIDGVNYVVCNTDRQALENSPIKTKVQIGVRLTEGLGAGNDPEAGKNSAIESADSIKAVLGGKTKMVFIAAGMGGGTGTGAAPVIAEYAKELKLLTVGIVHIPTRNEGKPRLMQALRGVEEMSRHVDSLLVINTNKLFSMYKSTATTVEDGFLKADNVLAQAAKGLAEMISRHRTVNVDFADVRTAMSDSGCALMGTGEASGSNRAIDAVKQAIESPLLNNNDINGSRFILVNITTSPTNKITLDEHNDIMDFLYEHAGGDDNDVNQIIYGLGADDAVEGDTMKVTVVATGFAIDCFSVQTRRKNEVLRINKDGDIEEVREEENTVKTVKLKDAETERLDNIIKEIYSEKENAHYDSKEYSTKNLRDASSIPLANLTEEALRQIEDTPAFERRAV